MKYLLSLFLFVAPLFAQFDRNIITLIPAPNSSGVPTTRGQLRFADLHTPWYSVAIQAPGTTLTQNLVITLPPSLAHGCVVDDGTGQWSIDPTCTGTANVVTTNTTQSISGQKTFTSPQTFQNVTVTGTCTGCGSAPADMMTTDTAQNVTATKQLCSVAGCATGVLVIVNPAGTITFQRNSGSGFTTQLTLTGGGIGGGGSVSTSTNGVTDNTMGPSGIDTTVGYSVGGVTVIDAARNATFASCTGCSPADMMTTDTTQTVTGAKTFTTSQAFCAVAGCASGAVINITNSGLINFMRNGSISRIGMSDGGGFGAGSIHTDDGSGTTVNTINGSGFNTTAGYSVGGSTVIDSARNATFASCTGCAPANMMTTDTSQTVTGAKAFTASQAFCAVAACNSGAVINITNSGLINFLRNGSTSRIGMSDGGGFGAGSIHTDDVNGTTVNTINGSGFNTTVSFLVNGSTAIDSSRNGFLTNLTVSGTCTGCVAPNMMTTDTTQTVTGAKTFTTSQSFCAVAGCNSGAVINITNSGLINFMRNGSISRIGMSDGGGFGAGSIHTDDASGTPINTINALGFGTTAAFLINGSPAIDSSRNGFLTNLTVTGTCTGCGSSPADMMTTDTSQTVTGAKIFTASQSVCAVAACNNGSVINITNGGIINFLRNGSTSRIGMSDGGSFGGGSIHTDDVNGTTVNLLNTNGINTTVSYSVNGTSVIDSSRNIFANTISAGGQTVIDAGRNGSFQTLTFGTQLVVLGTTVMNSSRDLLNIHSIAAAGGAFGVGTLGTTTAPNFNATNSGGSVAFQTSNGAITIFGTGTIVTSGSVISDSVLVTNNFNANSISTSGGYQSGSFQGVANSTTCSHFVGGLCVAP